MKKLILVSVLCLGLAIFAYGVPNLSAQVEASQATIYTIPGPGAGSHLKGFNDQGEALIKPNILTYANSYRGGARLASCNLNGIGPDEIVTVPRKGGGPQVQFFSKNGVLLGSFWWGPDRSYRDGLDVACGDIDNDGRDEVTVAQNNDGSRVRVYNVDNWQAAEFASWLAFGETAIGANVAMGDLDGDGQSEVLVGAGIGGAPIVRTFEADGERRSQTITVFEPDYIKGIDVASADFDQDGKDDIVVSRLAGSSDIRTYKSGGSERLFGAWKAYGTAPVGARIDAQDIQGDAEAEVVTAAGDGGGPQVRSFNRFGTPLGLNFFAYSTLLRAGVDIAVSTNADNL
ncbi:FG-GAP repeat domain-containing protein [Patescibacteria group bacterium]